MTHGEIETQGSHEELIKGENSYKAMWQSMVQRQEPPEQPPEEDA
jgi:ABC-type multidrug transport system fused ATPase/permease subunit